MIWLIVVAVWQLSDFGLSMWGPTNSTFVTQSDVVGTFGYIAPEYFMYGKVSDKIDVYAFGVVLLELLSGREPIGLENPKGQESLVIWVRASSINRNLHVIIMWVLCLWITFNMMISGKAKDREWRYKRHVGSKIGWKIWWDSGSENGSCSNPLHHKGSSASP